MALRKLLKFGLWGLIAVAVLSFALSRLMAHRWGRDTAEVSIQQNGLEFSAKRNEVGLWKVTAKSEASLWFAFGYLQTLDREFQLEMFRLMATGRASSLLGPTQLARDRIMRFSAELARREWNALPEDSLPRRAATAFVQGRNRYLLSPLPAEPVEFRFFGRTRKSFDPWEPWEVLALTRFHTWEFSHDFFEDYRAILMKDQLGPALTEFFLPPEPSASHALYDQVGLKAGLRPALSPNRRIPVPAFHLPAEKVAGSKLSPKDALPPPSDAAMLFESGFRDDIGASNLWMVADPKTTRPTLCNDTHLPLSWPSPFYPMSYVIPGRVSGSGFALPGLPALLIGQVHDLNAEQKPVASLAWGITIASFADTQDLIRLSPPTLASARHRRETFIITDPRTGTSETKVTDETWTAFGPRVDDIFEWKGNAKKPGAVALDWLGFRELNSPLEFFLRRNLRGAKGLREDLAQNWSYPSVNFTWMERVGELPVRMGHAVTGLIFSRPRRERGLIDEAEARRRGLSQPGARPYIDFVYDGRAPFFLATANQRPWSGALGLTTAFDWVDPGRADRIESRASDIRKNPEIAQSDYFSPALFAFVHDNRRLVSADELCGAEGLGRTTSPCIDILAGLDSWDGVAGLDSSSATLAALWYVKLKKSLVPAQTMHKTAVPDETLYSWHRSVPSLRVMRDLGSRPEARAKWERLTGRKYREEVIAAFASALQDLARDLSPSPAEWKWGRVHQIRWRHPFALLPEPLGDIMRKGLWGEAPPRGGAIDSPGLFDFSWKHTNSTSFPSNHGATMRMCVSFPVNRPGTVTRWSPASGVSGNPFSKWAWAFSRPYFLKDRLFEEFLP